MLKAKQCFQLLSFKIVIVLEINWYGYYSQPFTLNRKKLAQEKASVMIRTFGTKKMWKHSICKNPGHWHIMPHLPKPVWGGAFVHINELPTLIGGASRQDMLTIQLLEKGEFKEAKLKFTPDITSENQRKYSVAIIAHERYVCF